MVITENNIKDIVRRVLTSYSSCGQVPDLTKSDCCGVFGDINEAVGVAKRSQQLLSRLSLEKRAKIIASMRSVAMKNVKRLSEMAREETGFGKVEDKILKNILAIEKTPGIEDIVSVTYTGDHGLTLVESAPYGVIGAITPSTNPTSTIINNSISMIAAGNSVVFNPHPSAKNCSLETIKSLNEAI